MPIVVFRIVVAWMSVMRNNCQGVEVREGGGMVTGFMFKLWVVYRITQGNLRGNTRWRLVAVLIEFAMKCSPEFQNLPSQHFPSYIFTFLSWVWGRVWFFNGLWLCLPIYHFHQMICLHLCESIHEAVSHLLSYSSLKPHNVLCVCWPTECFTYLGPCVCEHHIVVITLLKFIL